MGMSETVEFTIKPVIKYVLRRSHKGVDERGWHYAGVDTIGTFESEDLAEAVRAAMALTPAAASRPAGDEA
jgi:hypothetical protein